jgi:hypothetical protein
MDTGIVASVSAILSSSSSPHVAPAATDVVDLEEWCVTATPEQPPQSEYARRLASGLVFLLRLGGRRHRLQGRGLRLRDAVGADLVLRAEEEHVGREVRRLRVVLGPGHGGRCGKRVVGGHPLLLLNPRHLDGHQRSGPRGVVRGGDLRHEL